MSKTEMNKTRCFGFSRFMCFRYSEKLSGQILGFGARHCGEAHLSNCPINIHKLWEFEIDDIAFQIQLSLFEVILCEPSGMSMPTTGCHIIRAITDLPRWLLGYLPVLINSLIVDSSTFLLQSETAREAKFGS